MASTCSRVIEAASRSIFSRIRAARRNIICCLPNRLVFLHVLKAREAASTAAVISSVVDSGTCVTTVWVAGSRKSIHLLVEDLRKRLSMKLKVRLGSLTWLWWVVHFPSSAAAVVWISRRINGRDGFDRVRVALRRRGVARSIASIPKKTKVCRGGVVGRGGGTGDERSCLWIR